ncbi:aspartic peptidase domain-containing protein [Gorgonomyces haynaldii]|nr:aspartic peptidase domain-containing protein [Gorgonomyces haynaldii]
MFLFAGVFAKNLVQLPRHEQVSIPISVKATVPSIQQVGTLPCADTALTLVGYVQVGTPPQSLAVQFDTGSDLFWVTSTSCTTATCKQANAFDNTKSRTYKQSVGPTQVTKYAYVDGTNLQCRTNMDVFSLAGIDFGLSNVCEAFTYNTNGGVTDGLIGLGPPKGQLSSADVRLPFQNSNITQVSFYFNRAEGVTGFEAGEITFGTPNLNRTSSGLLYAPITSDRNYWSVLVTSITQGTGSNLLSSPMSVIVDTGTSLTYLPSSLINNMIKGAKVLQTDSKSGIIYLDCTTVKNLPDLVFKIGDATLRIPYQYQIIVDTDYCISMFAVGTETDALLGADFLGSFYTSFDYQGQRIGFANLKDTPSVTIPNKPSGPLNNAATGVFSWLFLIMLNLM